MWLLRVRSWEPLKKRCLDLDLFLGRPKPNASPIMASLQTCRSNGLAITLMTSRVLLKHIAMLMLEPIKCIPCNLSLTLWLGRAAYHSAMTPDPYHLK